MKREKNNKTGTWRCVAYMYVHVQYMTVLQCILPELAHTLYHVFSSFLIHNTTLPFFFIPECNPDWSKVVSPAKAKRLVWSCSRWCRFLCIYKNDCARSLTTCELIGQCQWHCTVFSKTTNHVGANRGVVQLPWCKPGRRIIRLPGANVIVRFPASCMHITVPPSPSSPSPSPFRDWDSQSFLRQSYVYGHVSTYLHARAR